MKKLTVLLAAVALLSVAGSANAVPSAGGQLSVTIGTLPGLTVGVNAAGVNDSANATTVTMGTTGAITGTDTFIGITNAPPITRVQLVLTGNEATSTGAFGVLVAGNGAANNRMALKGVANIVGYGGAVTLVGAPLSAFGDPAGSFSTVTLGMGIITFSGTGWTTGSAVLVVPVTTIGGGTQTATTTTVAGTNMLTAGGFGQVTFISPTVIRTNLAGDLPTVAALTLVFVPEPGTLLLLGSGIVGLAAFGRSRARK